MVAPAERKESLSKKADVPEVSRWLQNGFHRFLRVFLKRHFHAIAIDRASRCEQSIAPDQPLIVYGNHPGWWDPLMAHYLNRNLFPQRQFYAPIDAEALEQYRVFARLGFYGVQLQTAKGAADFLRNSVAILRAGDTSIWMTPEGRFADVRDRSARLMPGLAHLCTRMESGCALPLALEYVFWEERLPICLISMGQPQAIDRLRDLTKLQASDRLEQALRDTQDRLMNLSMQRSSAPFDNLLHGTAGPGTTYGLFRRLFAWGQGRRIRDQHGDQFE